MAGWRENVRKVTPYVPGEQPKQAGKGQIIKLNTNENPYPPAPEVAECLGQMDTAAFRLYPNTDAAPIIKGLSERLELPAEWFFVGVGSDDVFATAFQTFFSGTKPVLFPDVTYSFYDVWAELYRVPYRRVPVGEDFRIRAEDYCSKKDGGNGGIVLANPNAPTGIYEPLSFIENIVSQNPDSVVIVDEAYIDFVRTADGRVGAASAIPLTKQYDNLLVVQTFSKSRSMAGMRIGYAIGQPELIAALNAVKFSCNSYTMNYPAQLLGAASLQAEEYFRKTVFKVMDTRERYRKKLEELGFLCTDSRANFLFVTHPGAKAEELLAELRKEDIIVRHFKAERIRNYLRITIGTEEEMERLTGCLQEILEK